MRKEYEINLDIWNKCTLQCMQCHRQSDLFTSSAQARAKPMSMGDWKKIVDHYKDSITFCGQVSDPVLHPKLDKILKDTYERNIKTKVATAVSHKPLDWYIKCFEANPNATWIFGLDGLPHQSHIYRKNQDGEKLFEIMKIARNMRLNVIWQWIVFNYNQNDIDHGIVMAKAHGMDFTLTQSNRWWKMEHLKPDAEFLPT